MTNDNKKQHVQVPDPVKKTKLKPFDKLVYANLRRHMDKDTYECFPTIRRIASECGCTEKRVTNSIERLIEAGDIEKLSVSVDLMYISSINFLRILKCLQMTF